MSQPSYLHLITFDIYRVSELHFSRTVQDDELDCKEEKYCSTKHICFPYFFFFLKPLLVEQRKGCLETNLTRLKQAAGGSLPPHSVVLSVPCWHSPAHGSGRSHDPTPGEWSPRWLGCLCLNARSEAGLPGRLSVRRRAEVTRSHPPNARSMVGWTDPQARPTLAPGPRKTLRYRRLQAEEKVHHMGSF